MKVVAAAVMLLVAAVVLVVMPVQLVGEVVVVRYTEAATE